MGKIKSSAFWWFMRHLQEEEHMRSGRNVSMGELNKIAGERWKQMTAEEKKPFIDRHESYKSGSRAPLTDFRDSLRRTSSVTIKQEPDPEDISRPESRCSTASSSVNLVREITRKKKIMNSLAKFIQDVATEKLMKTRFYTIASNVMCATRQGSIENGCVYEDTYYPLEVGIVEFNLSDGIIHDYNEFLDPGPIPVNMARICSAHQKKHGILLSNFCYAKGCRKIPDTEDYDQEARREDFDRVISDIHDLIVNSIIDEIQDDPKQQIKLLFCQRDQIYQNKGVLKALGREAGYDNFGDDVEILDSRELFFFLCRKKGFGIKAAVMDLLEITKFNYEGRCEFHESHDTLYCAISVAKRQCWLMFDKLCTLYNFEMTEKHCPIGKLKKSDIKENEEWLTWNTDTIDKPPTKTRFYDENSHESNRPVKVANTTIWPEAVGRGRHVNRDVHSVSRSQNPLIFSSSDVRERQKRVENEAEPTPGPSGVDYKPRLPGQEPTPNRSQDNDVKPKVSTSTPDTPRPLGRGRGRIVKPNI